MAASLLPEERALATLHTITLAVRNLASSGIARGHLLEGFRRPELDRLKPFKPCSPKAPSLRSKVWTKLKKQVRTNLTTLRVAHDP